MNLRESTRPQDGRTPLGELPAGIGLIAAELALAALWYPYVVHQLVARSRLPYAQLRLLIVFPEYALLAVAVSLIALSASRRTAAVAAAAAAGLLTWGVSLATFHLSRTPHDLDARRHLVSLLDHVALLGTCLLAAAAWGVARRVGRLWLLGLVLAPLLRWWGDHESWWSRIGGSHDLWIYEVVGMVLAILPVLVAVLAGRALSRPS